MEKTNLSQEIEEALRDGFTDVGIGITYSAQMVKVFIDEAIKRHNNKEWIGPFINLDLVSDDGMGNVTFFAYSNTPTYIVKNNIERPGSFVNVEGYTQSTHLLGSLDGLQIHVSTFIRKRDGVRITAVTRKDAHKIERQRCLI